MRRSHVPLNALSFKDVASGRTVDVGLPGGTRFAWPDGERLAFVVQEPAGLALWIADRAEGRGSSRAG